MRNITKLKEIAKKLSGMESAMLAITNSINGGEEVEKYTDGLDLITGLLKETSKELRICIDADDTEGVAERHMKLSSGSNEN